MLQYHGEIVIGTPIIAEWDGIPGTFRGAQMKVA